MIPILDEKRNKIGEMDPETGIGEITDPVWIERLSRDVLKGVSVDFSEASPVFSGESGPSPDGRNHAHRPAPR